MKVLDRGWPKKEVEWIDGRVLYVSIPFTWNLPGVRHRASYYPFAFYDRIVVGGPAVKLVPDFFEDIPWVTVGDHLSDALQRINRQATRTTVGCPNKCPFCAVPTICGEFRELEDWPDLPIICDDNLLAASTGHFNRVMDRLEKHEAPDINQGLDTRRLTEYHAERLARVPNLMVRLALDDMKYEMAFQRAFQRLRWAGVPKSRIRSYALIGYDTGPEEAWKRCTFLEDFGIKALPMWYHALDTLVRNQVSQAQQDLGWTLDKLRNIMQWYYHHKGEKRV